MYWKALDKVDSSLYKGIAVLMIVTHNFMHLFPVPKQNEFGFYPRRFFDFLDLAFNEPENIIRASLSFFGHFGVQIFVFLSAYGLTKKYLTHKPVYWLFIRQRMLKIYPAFLLAILAWLIVSGWITGGYGLLGPVKLVHRNFSALVFKLLLLSNFIPGYSLSPVGPWWFVPFIFQFYFVFPLLRHLHSCYGERVLLFMSAGGIVLCGLTQGEIGDLNIYFTVLGHLPELCLGIYLANVEDAAIRIPKLTIVSALIIYVLGNIYETFWYANHISFLVLLLVGFDVLVGVIKPVGMMRRVFLFFGSISMPLFLVNGFLREPFISWAQDYNHWLLTMALCLISLAVSTLVALVLAKIEEAMMPKVNGESPLIG